jgi:hypothetical protein
VRHTLISSKLLDVSQSSSSRKILDAQCLAGMRWTGAANLSSELQFATCSAHIKISQVLLNKRGKRKNHNVKSIPSHAQSFPPGNFLEMVALLGKSTAQRSISPLRSLFVAANAPATFTSTEHGDQRKCKVVSSNSRREMERQLTFPDKTRNNLSHITESSYLSVSQRETKIRTLMETAKDRDD